MYLLLIHNLPTLQKWCKQLWFTFMYRVVVGLVPAMQADASRLSKNKGTGSGTVDQQTVSRNLVENYIRNNNRCYSVPRCNTEQYK